VIQALHELWDAGGEVPPVHVQQINVVRLHLLEGGFERHVKGLGRVAGIVDAKPRAIFVRRVGVAGRKLGGEDDLVTHIPLLHPFADPGLGFFILVVVGSVNSIRRGQLLRFVGEGPILCGAKWNPTSSRMQSLKGNGETLTYQ
jgi:hypothetical protein